MGNADFVDVTDEDVEASRSSLEASRPKRGAQTGAAKKSGTAKKS